MWSWIVIIIIKTFCPSSPHNVLYSKISKLIKLGAFCTKLKKLIYSRGENFTINNGDVLAIWQQWVAIERETAYALKGNIFINDYTMTRSVA